MTTNKPHEVEAGRPMKQIVVNVDGLTIEEKKRVSEALAKIKNKSSTPKVTNMKELKWFYADSQIAWSYGDKSWFELPATHTPQQVLAMAEMEPAAEQTILADMLIITDSSGNIVYDSTLEEKKKGHVHAELMAQYAEDAKTHAEPWKLWQLQCTGDEWQGLANNPTWVSGLKYRRKPKTHFVHGVEIPDLRISLKSGDSFFLADPTSPKLTSLYQFDGDIKDEIWVERGLCYEPTEEGRQAAILHTNAMLGMVQ